MDVCVGAYEQGNRNGTELPRELGLIYYRHAQETTGGGFVCELARYPSFDCGAIMTINYLLMTIKKNRGYGASHLKW